MKKSIYDVYVTVTSQEQSEIAFYYHETSGNQFYCTIDPNVDGEVSAFTVLFDTEKTTKITESEFEKLAKEFKQ